MHARWPAPSRRAPTWPRPDRRTPRRPSMAPMTPSVSRLHATPWRERQLRVAQARSARVDGPRLTLRRDGKNSRSIGTRKARSSESDGPWPSTRRSTRARAGDCCGRSGRPRNDATVANDVTASSRSAGQISSGGGGSSGSPEFTDHHCPSSSRPSREGATPRNRCRDEPRGPPAAARLSRRRRGHGVSHRSLGAESSQPGAARNSVSRSMSRSESRNRLRFTPFSIAKPSTVSVRTARKHANASRSASTTGRGTTSSSTVPAA